MSTPLQSFIDSTKGAINGFQNPDQILSNDTNPINKFLDTIPGLKNIRGANAGAFGTQAVNNPQIQFGGEMETPQYLNPIKNEDAIQIANLQRLIHNQNGEISLPNHQTIMQLGDKYNINPKLDAGKMIGELAGALEPHQKATLADLLNIE